MDPVTEVTPETIETPEAPVAPRPETQAEEPTAPVAPTPAPETPEQALSGRDKRINQVIRERQIARDERNLERYQREETERQRDYWRQIAEGKAPQVDPQAAEPKAEQFETTEAYVKAVAVHQAKAIVANEIKALREADAQAAATREREEEEASTAETFAPQLAKARSRYEDFDEVVNAPVFSPRTKALLYISPHGAEIGYYLGKHPEEAAALNRLSEASASNPLSAAAAARSLVLLEQKMESSAMKKVSSAPPPISPVTGTATVVKDPEKMTTEEWMAWEKQQRIERLKQKPL